MLKALRTHLRYATALVRHSFRAYGKRRRSREWGNVKKLHKEMEPTCQACGTNKMLQVHHIRPFHLQPELELQLTNLITLCMGPNTCHIDIGHCDDYTAYNPNVRQDAYDILEARQRGDQAEVARILAQAKKKRLYAAVVRLAVVPENPDTQH